MGSKILKSLMSVVLVIGLMPTLAMADDATVQTPSEEDGAGIAAQTISTSDDSVPVAAVQEADAEDARPALVKGENDVFKEYVQDTELVATLTTDGTLTITGSGDMPNWQNADTDEGRAKINHTDNRPWRSKNVTKIVIGSGITRVGDLSFWGTCNNVTQIILPDSLKAIGFAAFSQQSPNTMIVPDGVKIDRGWACGPETKKIVFLGECDISNALGKVQYTYGWTGFTALVESGQTNLIADLQKSGKDGEKDINTCSNIEQCELLGACGGDEGYASSVYYSYKDGTLTISGSGSIRDYSAENKAPWADKEVENIVVEDGVTSIGAYAFANNTGIASVSVPTSVSMIGDNAFNVQSCKSDGTTFAVAKDSAADKWLTDRDLALDPTLDEHGRPYLQLNEGEKYKDYIGTTQLVATLTNDGTLTISGEGAMPVWVSNSEASGADNFYTKRPWQKYEGEVQRIVVADGVTSVGNLSFYLCCSNVKEILLADTVTSIGHAAFSWQQKLTSVAIPQSVKSLTSWAFSWSVKDTYYLGADNMSSKQNLLYNYNQSPKYNAHCLEGSKTASNVANDATVAPNGVKTYQAGELGACGVAPFSSSVYYAYDSETKTLNIMGTQAMRDYSDDDPAPWSSLDVRNVVVSKDVQHIGSHAFCGNSGISYVSVANGSTTIGDHAFDTAKLNSIYFVCSDNSKIAKWVTDNGGSLAVSEGSCGDFATWKFEGTTLTISGSGAMANYSADNAAPWAGLSAFVDSVVVESGITSIGDYCFAGLSNVSNVSIPATVSAIGEKSFADCAKLASLRLPEHTKQVKGSSFENCADSLTISGYQTTVDAFAEKLTQGKTTINVTVPTRLKVLFVGNSFSQNAVSQLEQIARSAGVEETLVANLHKSAHPLSGYVANSTSKANEYEYAERGTLADTSHNRGVNGCNLDYGLTAQDWDIVVLQPYCWQSYAKENGPQGEQFVSASGYENIKTLAAYAKANTSNPEAKLAFYQIWSRPFDYLQFDSANDHIWDGGYVDGVTSQSVWKVILDAYDYKSGESPFTYYVPVGTAIENARLTSLEESPVKVADTGQTYKQAVGSGLNSDNIHLNAWGSYIDGLTFTKALTGLSIDDVTYKPSSMTDGEMALAKAAVNAAFDGPSKNAQGNVNALTYAKVGDMSFSTLAEAVAAAKSGDVLELFGMPKSDGDLTIAAGVTVKTYGSQAAHTIALTSGGVIGTNGLIANSGAVVDGTATNAPVSIDAVTGAATTQNVAEWNGTQYASVQEAINAAAEAKNCTSANPVKLLCSVAEPVTIAEGTTIALDLNGFTLSDSAVAQDKNVSDADRHHTITNNGYLEIRDSSENHTGAVDNVSHSRGALWNGPTGDARVHGGKFWRSAENGNSSNDSGGNSWYTIKNYGAMTIDGANVNVIQGADGKGGFSSLIANGWQGVSGEPTPTSAGAMLTIEKGMFNGGLNTIKNDGYGHLTINGGSFKNQKQAALLNWSVATIDGGDFQVSDSATYIVLNSQDKDNAEEWSGNLTIAGGTFGNESGSNVKLIKDFGDGYPFGSATVSGGTFTGTLPSGLAGLTVSGGAFSDDSFKDYCEPGYAPSKNATGTYSPATAKSWTTDLSQYGKDSAPDATTLGYTADEAKTLAFAGWYVSDAEDAAAFTATTGKAYAKFVKISDLIKFRGGSLRIDGPAVTESTSFRFGYFTSVPDGAEYLTSGWNWFVGQYEQDYAEAKSRVVYEDGSAMANLVVTELPTAWYGVDVKVREHLEYRTADGTKVAIDETDYNARSVYNVAEKIVKSGAGKEQKDYAQSILDTKKVSN